MRSELLAISDLDARDIAAWERLGRRAASPNPFFEPDFVLPAMRAWDAGDVGVLVARDGEEWLGAIPVRSVRSWRGVPGRCLAGWRHPYCYLGTPLVTGDDPEGVLAALIDRGLRSERTLALDWVQTDGPVAPSLASALASRSRPIVVEVFERAALYRRPAGDYLQQAISPRHIKEYERKRKRLEREVGELTLRDVSDDPAAYRRFLDIERAGWKGKGGTGTAMDCIPGHGLFFTEVCERFSRSGRLLLLSLSSGQQTVAMRSEFIAGDVTFNFKIAFDEEFARFSPGIQLYIANIERFHASGRAWSDSCTGPNNATLNRLWSGRRRLRSVVAARKDLAGVVQTAKWRGAAAALPLRRRLLAARQGTPNAS